MSRSECYAPVIERWIVVDGTPDAPLRNIGFENIAFRHTSYITPAQGEEPRQAAAYASAAIELRYAENVVFADCEMEHTGGYALWFKEGCCDNRVERCYMADLGAGGIKVGVPWIPARESAVCRRNVVDNNIITRTGRELPCGVGVAIFHAADNRVTHNDIFDLKYSGVSVGWVWGYNDSDKLWTDGVDERGNVVSIQRPLKSPATGNIVAYNRIHHIGWGELSDMGAVYTLGESPGTKVSHNVIHDVVSYDYGGWGLYTDEGSTDVEMSCNLVYRCKSGGFHQHYGKNNRIENNIFAFGSLFQLQFSRVEPHTSFSFRHNIVLQDRGETLRGAWDKARIEMDSNLYWHLEGKPSFLSYKTMDEWRKIKDAHSIVADPMFVDAARGDFRFRSKKSIRKIGFEPFDYSEAGVYGDEDWRRRAVMPDEAQAAFARIAARHGF